MEMCIIILIFVTVTLKTLEASTYSCPVSRSTVQVVYDCPDSVEKWREAAARKNCSAYASQCDKPDKLVYHCVINTDISQMLEVCAYAQNIVLGHCTEYSLLGNLIQPHLDTNCLVFTVKQCPQFYRSDEAYKYPGCYNLTKTLQSTNQPDNTEHSGITTIDKPDISSNISRNEDEMDPTHGQTLVISIVTLVTILFLCASVSYIWFKRKKKYRDDDPEKNESEGILPKDSKTVKDDDPERNESGSILLWRTDTIKDRDTENIDSEKIEWEEMDTKKDDGLERNESKRITELKKSDTENDMRVVAPSGQQIETGGYPKIMTKVEEEEEPEIPINEEEKREQECQRLLEIINDDLARIAYLLYESNKEVIPAIDDMYNDPLCLFNESNENLNKTSTYLKSFIKDYFKTSSYITTE